MTLTTTLALDYVKAQSAQNYGAGVELSIVNSGLRATHYIEYWEGRFYDTGIDGERYRTSRKALLERYPNTIWTID